MLIDEFWAEYTASSNPIRRLTLSNLQPNGAKDWSVLSGPLIKSANTRHFCPCLEVIARKYCDSGSDIDRHTLKAISSLNRVYHILYSSGMFLTPDQHASLTEAVLDLGVSIQWIRQISDAMGQLWFQFTPKVHYGMHAPSQSKLLSSRATQCYCAESLVGKMCKIWKSCAEGPYSRTIQQTALTKYVTVVASVFEL